MDLGTLAGLGQLERMTQFRGGEADLGPTDLGIFAYPVLRAADILVHKAPQCRWGTTDISS